MTTHIPFPSGTLLRARLMAEAAPINVQNRLVGLLKEDAIIEAARVMRVAELRELDEEIAAVSLQLEMTAREERRTGRPEEREIRTINEDRSETVELIQTGTLTKLKAKLDGLKARRAKIAEVKSKPKWGRRVLELLADHRGTLVEDTSEIADDQHDGETLAEPHARKWHEQTAWAREVSAMKNGTISAAEAIPFAHAWVDKTARAPGLGGFTRGTHLSRRGGLGFGPPPDAEPDFATKLFVAQVDPVDTIATLCWAIPDIMKERLARELREKYDNPAAISAAIRREQLPLLERKLWQCRRELELITLKSIAAGITNLNRPKDTPIAILLNVLPFSQTLGFTYDPVDPAREPDFEEAE